MRPKPFQRDSVDLGTPAREWRYIKAQEVQVGDTLSGMGRVVDIKLANGQITFGNPLGVVHVCDPTELFLGFVPRV